jgi:hypothetical protein
MKTTITSDTVDFTFNDKIVLTLEKSLFTSLWPERLLEETAQRLQKRYKEVANIDKPQAYFEERLTDVMGQVIEEKLDEKFSQDSKRIASFLTYHVKTLLSIRKKMKNDKEAMFYVDQELYSVQNITAHDLYDILDTITEKKNRK